MTSTSIAPSELRGGAGAFEGERTFPCEACGAKLTFSIGAQKLRCSHCGHEKALTFEPDAQVRENDLQRALSGEAARRETAGKFAGTHEVKCSTCGATVVFSGSLTSTACAYCAAPIQRENAHVLEHRLPVDGLCTFQVEKEQAQQRLNNWVKGRWFAPNVWKQSGVNGKFDGLYLPFFTFDALTYTHYRGERGDAYYVEVGSGQNKRRERRINWTWTSGAFERFFDDVTVAAFASLPKSLIDKLGPWPLERLVPFSDAALAGKLAHTYEVELRPAFAEAEQRMRRVLEGDVRQRIGGDEQRISDMNVQVSAVTFKHVLLPVWMLVYRFNQKSFRVVINATTGQVFGERPYSAIKIAAAVVLGVAVAALIAVFSQHR